MLREPQIKRAFAFIDASNVRIQARRAFGESFGNFNPVALAEEVCAAQGWQLAGVGCYLGVPDVRITEDGHYTWIKRCARWRKQGVHVFTRTLLQGEDGVAREKGIDVRIALDAVRHFRSGAYDVALVFSQDQDFSELAAELRAIAQDEKRWLHVVSAFPASDIASAATGISGMIPVPLDGALFSKVLDTADNRRRVHTPLVAPAPRPVKSQSMTPPATERMPVADAWATALPSSSLAFAQERAAKPVRLKARSVLIGLIIAYFAVALATFGYLSWMDRNALADQRAVRAVLTDHLRDAALWPSYWIGMTDLGDLGQQMSKLPGHPFGL